MSVDIENIKGVFADLDDGGLDESEALAQIRDLLGVEPQPKKIVFTYLVPVNVTVDLENECIASAEFDNQMYGLMPGTGASDTITGAEIDPDKFSAAIEKAKSIADEAGWENDITNGN